MAVLCLGGLAGWSATKTIPRQAEQVFGAPSPQLGAIERVVLAVRLLQSQETLTTPANPFAGPTLFKIELGETATSITDRLNAAGLISDSGSFALYLRYGGKDTTLQAGDYSLSAAMTPIEIAEALLDATPNEIPFRVLAGWRLEEIAGALPTSGLNITPNQFLIEARRNLEQYPVEKYLPPDASLEGFLFPGEYIIPRGETANGLIMNLVEMFEANMGEELLAGFEAQGLSVFDAVILASIVERETVVIDEAPEIASVYLNRLAIGMNLDADPTVQYAIGYNSNQSTWWTNPLSLLNLQVDSPYNTYIYPGLPPGPIANPGIEALRAVANPAQTPYYYFRAACDKSGRHNFSVTFEEHAANGCEGEN